MTFILSAVIISWGKGITEVLEKKELLFMVGKDKN